MIEGCVFQENALSGVNEKVPAIPPLSLTLSRRLHTKQLVCFFKKISMMPLNTQSETVSVSKIKQKICSCSVTYKLLLLICAEPCHLLFVGLHLLFVVLEVSHYEPGNNMEKSASFVHSFIYSVLLQKIFS